MAINQVPSDFGDVLHATQEPIPPCEALDKRAVAGLVLALREVLHNGILPAPRRRNVHFVFKPNPVI